MRLGLAFASPPSRLWRRWKTLGAEVWSWQPWALVEQALDAARRSERIRDVRYPAGEIGSRDLLASQDRSDAAEVAVGEDERQGCRQSLI